MSQRALSNFETQGELPNRLVLNAIVQRIGNHPDCFVTMLSRQEYEYLLWRRDMVSLEVGKKAIDFLMEASKHRTHVEVDLFGGDFQVSLVRFLKCLSDENEAKVLGKALKREVLYRALCGEQAELLLKLSLQAGPLVQINKVIDVLEQNYNQEIDVDNLAKEVNLSVSSFYLLFKDVTSDTPVQYLKKIRLNKAKEMIITQNAKAYVAALEVGYQSVSQFSREFKRYFGVTPAALKVS